jgi:AbrB family looped-hinge helix DNA binding protein
MKTTVSSKGQIVLPAELRQQDQVEPGQEFEIERRDRGEYRLVRRKIPPNEGLVDWLLDATEVQSATSDFGFELQIRPISEVC